MLVWKEEQNALPPKFFVGILISFRCVTNRRRKRFVPLTAQSVPIAFSE